MTTELPLVVPRYSTTTKAYIRKMGRCNMYKLNCVLLDTEREASNLGSQDPSLEAFKYIYVPSLNLQEF